jgi:hypothetical protein
MRSADFLEFYDNGVDHGEQDPSNICFTLNILAFGVGFDTRKNGLVTTWSKLDGAEWIRTLVAMLSKPLFLLQAEKFTCNLRPLYSGT